MMSLTRKQYETWSPLRRLSCSGPLPQPPTPGGITQKSRNVIAMAGMHLYAFRAARVLHSNTLRGLYDASSQILRLVSAGSRTKGWKVVYPPAYYGADWGRGGPETRSCHRCNFRVRSSSSEGKSISRTRSLRRGIHGPTGHGSSADAESSRFARPMLFRTPFIVQRSSQGYLPLCSPSIHRCGNTRRGDRVKSAP